MGFDSKCFKAFCGLTVVGIGVAPLQVFAQDSGIWADVESEVEAEAGVENTTVDSNAENESAGIVTVSESDAATDVSVMTDVPDYDAELLRVESEVQELKERVFRSKATLALLREIMIQGSSSGAHATIWHVNRLGGGYSLESLSYRLDGQATPLMERDAGLNEMEEIAVFDGPLSPGPHNLTVEMRLRGTGYGVFTYVQNYEIDVENSTNFDAEDGKSCSIRVVADERMWVEEEVLDSERGRPRRHLSSFLERPNITIEEARCTSLTGVSGDEDN